MAAPQPKVCAFYNEYRDVLTISPAKGYRVSGLVRTDIDGCQTNTVCITTEHCMPCGMLVPVARAVQALEGPRYLDVDLHLKHSEIQTDFEFHAALKILLATVGTAPNMSDLDLRCSDLDVVANALDQPLPLETIECVKVFLGASPDDLKRIGVGRRPDDVAKRNPTLFVRCASDESPRFKRSETNKGWHAEAESRRSVVSELQAHPAWTVRQWIDDEDLEAGALDIPSTKGYTVEISAREVANPDYKDAVARLFEAALAVNVNAFGMDPSLEEELRVNLADNAVVPLISYYCFSPTPDLQAQAHIVLCVMGRFPSHARALEIEQPKHELLRVSRVINSQLGDPHGCMMQVNKAAFATCPDADLLEACWALIVAFTPYKPPGSFAEKVNAFLVMAQLVALSRSLPCLTDEERVDLRVAAPTDYLRRGWLDVPTPIN